jgi:hypothetical protein
MLLDAAELEPAWPTPAAAAGVAAEAGAPGARLAALGVALLPLPAALTAGPGPTAVVCDDELALGVDEALAPDASCPALEAWLEHVAVPKQAAAHRMRSHLMILPA